jgi:hypothetical protein
MDNKPLPKDWLKLNPGRTLNDYFRLYPEGTQTPKVEQRPFEQKKNEPEKQPTKQEIYEPPKQGNKANNNTTFLKAVATAVWKVIKLVAIIIFVILYLIFKDNGSSEGNSSPSTQTSSAGYTSSERGEVIWVGSGCNYVIIEAGSWYVLAETYSGYLSTGDKLEGENLNSYGFKNCKKNVLADTRIYIENYYGTKDRCFEWLRDRDKCGF